MKWIVSVPRLTAKESVEDILRKYNNNGDTLTEQLLELKQYPKQTLWMC